MSDTNTTYEYCPYCDTEVELEATMGVQQCPNCGKALATCSLCAECIKPCLYEQAAEALNDLQTLTTTLDEALRRERIAVQELQKMRQRAETAEKKLQTYECSYCAQCKIRNQYNN